MLIGSPLLSAYTMVVDRLCDVLAHRTITFFGVLTEEGIRLGSRSGVDFFPVIVAQQLFSQYKKIIFFPVHMGAVVSDIQETGRLYHLSRHQRTCNGTLQVFVKTSSGLRDHTMLPGKFFDALRYAGIVL